MTIRTNLPEMQLSLIVSCCTAAVVMSAAAELPIKVSLDERAGRAEVTFKKKRVLLYSFDQDQFKPYVRELYTLAGENILLDGPLDHLHHHGLMYAIRVNGINFWEETLESGRQKHISILQRIHAESDDSLSADLIQTIHWTAPRNDRPLLIECRVITVRVNEKADEVAVGWQASFTVGQEALKIHGSAYNGLGMRLPPSWNRTAIHQNSENVPYTTEQTGDVTSARWAAVSRVGERGSTVLLFGSPGNPGETRFFSMVNPFTYLSATQNLELRPLNYGSGEKFGLSYLLLAYSRRKSAEFINERYLEWLKINKTAEQTKPRASDP